MNQILQSSMNSLTSCDSEIGSLIEQEFSRQNRNIELIASENIASAPVVQAMGTILTNKYAEGLPANRYYGGCDFVDEIERICIARAKALFGAEFVNVQPHSGSQANLAAYGAVLKPGDTLLGMDLASGGHLTHGAKCNQSGKIYNSMTYGVNPETGLIDYDEIESMIKKYQPKLLVAGASAYPRAIDFKTLGELAHQNGALFMVDMAHIAGLVAGGVHMSPVPYADIVTTTTHKTLRGPRGGLIMAREELSKKINSAVFPGSQGGPLMHVLAAKAICLQEALQPSFREYAQNIVKNSKALAAALLERGFDLVSGGTDNHLMLADLRSKNITGKELQTRLDEVHITVNKNAIPNDPASPNVCSGVRIGTPAVTTRGFGTEDMAVIADCINDVVTDFEGTRKSVIERVDALTGKYPIYNK